jgi:hypothetical protein
MPKQLPPNKALLGFEPFIGTWDTTGTHGMLPGTMVKGRTSFEWHESGAFIVVKSTVDDERFPSEAVAMIGSDDVLGTYAMLYYDARGVSRIQNVSLEGATLRWSRDAPAFSQRYVLTLSEDHQTIVGKGEISKDGTTWEKDLDQDYTKVTV